MESMKNQIEMNPLKVWSDDSVCGIAFIVLLAQTIVSMIRFENETLRPCSTKFIIRSLENLTVTYMYDSAGGVRRIYSNFDAMNSLILKDVVVRSGVSGG